MGKISLFFSFKGYDELTAPVTVINMQTKGMLVPVTSFAQKV